MAHANKVKKGGSIIAEKLETVLDNSIEIYSARQYLHFHGIAGPKYIMLIGKDVNKKQTNIFAEFTNWLNSIFNKGKLKTLNFYKVLNQELLASDTAIAIFIKQVEEKEKETLEYLNKAKYIFTTDIYGYTAIDSVIYSFVKYVDFDNFTSSPINEVLLCIALRDLHSLNVMHDDFHLNNYGFFYDKNRKIPFIFDIGGSTLINTYAEAQPNFYNSSTDFLNLMKNYNETFNFLLKDSTEKVLISKAPALKEIQAGLKCMLNNSFLFETSVELNQLQKDIKTTYTELSALQDKIFKIVVKNNRIIDKDTIQLIDRKNELLLKLIDLVYKYYEDKPNHQIGAASKYKYNGKLYKIHTGKRGGKFIIMNKATNKKIYV